ncbi:hypoxanthine phosphoribosyltransferase [Desulfocicer vacuolatum DSM 3385]|uniref:Hypoxanthine phosphoribosyltransferase n=1 Tax=Desulfocicer vacuolatum DSM 3385 TaxID=1121400 RepID=A0A1W2B722_9BACT|nr:hypoxanthine phosphoribosyltransferase [Desulfocicer vacuolatum]SMC68590.1 hypoxanthine phosphoribosyltransferase [Desulfocicer vacuolatum DSM 3385]
MTTLIPMISQKEITQKVKEIGRQISLDYENKELILIGILKGSFVFLADLTRVITLDHQVDLVGVSSYSGTSTTGIIKFTKEPDLELKGKDILIVEDIVDTGRTLSALLNFFKTYEPGSMKVCTLIDKSERRETPVDVDYACFHLNKGFIVGYGLDYDQKYRNLPAIFDLKL